MSKIQEYRLKDLLQEELKDGDFQKEYAALEEEFLLAKEVIKLRNEKKLSQKELAEIAGTSQPAIARLESGRYKNVSMSFLRKIGKALDVVPEIHFRKAQ